MLEAAALTSAPRRRRRAVAVLVAVGALLLVGSAVWAVSHGDSSPSQPPVDTTGFDCEGPPPWVGRDLPTIDHDDLVEQWAAFRAQCEGELAPGADDNTVPTASHGPAALEGSAIAETPTKEPPEDDHGRALRPSVEPPPSDPAPANPDTPVDIPDEPPAHPPRGPPPGTPDGPPDGTPDGPPPGTPDGPPPGTPNGPPPGTPNGPPPGTPNGPPPGTPNGPPGAAGESRVSP
jgi:hypothetical protein